MKAKKLKIVLISTPIGFLGSGQGGGVELTLTSLMKGLLYLGHEIILVAPSGSKLPFDCNKVSLKEIEGIDQPGWQKRQFSHPLTIPFDGVLPKMLKAALDISKDADAILNLSYDWLPLWMTPYVDTNIFHLISMGAVSKVMKKAIEEVSLMNHSLLAFHTNSQASDYELIDDPIIVGNGFDLEKYEFQPDKDGPIGWAGRIAPEKGLEDALSVAVELGEELLVWGLIEDKEYARKLEEDFPGGTIKWQGYLQTSEFQKELGRCRALINTPKWNEAFGNVVVEALACGVPVVAYKRGGPGELIEHGVTGWLAPPDDVALLLQGVLNIHQIDRKECRIWSEKNACYKSFAMRIINWLYEGIATGSYQLKNK